MNLFWNLFEKTGKVEYYLKYKEESKEKRKIIYGRSRRYCC
ncbi:MAG: hypothetical protein V8R01_03075 [Bacilli bacterium]